MAAEMDLIALIDEFGDEDSCREYLEALRWPDGVECPRCQGRKIGRIVKRNQFECSDPKCRYQFSVRAGTIFQDSKLSLRKWFLATYIICEAKKGISSNQLSRMLKVTTKTGWFLTHRIRAAMAEAGHEMLEGVVEVDETWVGGHTRGKGRGFKGNKTIVAGAIERGGDVRFRIIESRDGAALGSFIRDHVKADTDIYTDDLPAYRSAKLDEDKHKSVNHSKDEWVRGDVHTNTVEGVWSLLKRSIVGSYHQLSVKHLDAYLDEIAFRFNNRDNPYLFRDTIKRLVSADALTYEALIAEQPTG